MNFRISAWAVCGLALVIIVCAVALAALNHYGGREAPTSWLQRRRQPRWVA